MVGGSSLFSVFIQRYPHVTRLRRYQSPLLLTAHSNHLLFKALFLDHVLYDEVPPDCSMGWFANGSSKYDYRLSIYDTSSKVALCCIL